MRLLLAVLFFLAVPGVPAYAAAPVRETGADYVIIAGAPGLRWSDVSEQDTPTLWRLAERGAIGSLSVRSAVSPTCPVDGWVTLGAGNYAFRTASPTPECAPVDVTIERPDAQGAYLPDQSAVVDAQQDKPYGAVPGALAESLRCTSAVGPGAAIAAARPFGRVDHYAPELGDNALLSTCALSIVELGSVSGPAGELRLAQVKAVDAMLERLDKARPEGATIVIAGVSDTSADGRLHLVAIDGPGWQGGWLTSLTTGRRNGYLELVDLAPTALAMLGRALPDRVFAGSPASAASGRPAELGKALGVLAGSDQRASASLSAARWFFTLVALIQIGLFLALIPLLRRSYLHAGPLGPQSPSPRLVSALEVLLIGSSLLLPAALLADLVPWWRSSWHTMLFALLTFALTALLTFGVTRLPASKRTLVPLGVVSSFAAALISIDLLTGARLQLNGVVGYSSLQGGRYAGLGIVIMGVFIAGVLMCAGWLSNLVRVNRRAWLVAGIGAVAVVLVGSPRIGADAGGAVALTAGVCLVAAMVSGGWLTFSRLAWSVLAGFAVTTLFALIDVRRPVEDQGSLGRFLNQIADGTASLTLARVGQLNVAAFTTSALTILALASALFVWLVLLRPWGGLKRLFGIYPPIRAAAIGITIATVIAGILGGAAFNVAGAAAATVVPLLALSSLRALEHAADRTRAQDSPGEVLG